MRSALLVWLTVSLSWAEHDATTGSRICGSGGSPGFAFLVSITTISTPRQARLFVLVLIIGALLSALIGILGQSLSTHSDSLALASADRQRFGSLLDDPNYVAAGFVAAIVLATGLLRPRHLASNVLLLVGMGILTVSLAATSRAARSWPRASL